MTLSPRFPWLLLAPLLTAIAVAGFPPPVSAQGSPFWWGGGGWSYPAARPRNAVRPRGTARQNSRVEESKPLTKEQNETKKAEKTPTGPLFAVVSLSDQRISVYNADGLVARSRISSGMPGYRTPTGIFTIIQRNRYHRSNIYAGAPMPYMQRLTWSGIALHQGVVPGYPASHGCIRLPGSFAVDLWGMTRIGERVVVAQHDVSPEDFSHPRLPAPAMQPPPMVASGQGAPPLKPGSGQAGAGLTQVATADQAVPAALTAPANPRLLNPMEYARELKAKAAADGAEAARAVKAAVETAAAKAAAARRAAADFRQALAAQERAEAKVAARAKAIATARTAEAAEVAETAKADAEAELAAAVRAVEAAQAAERRAAEEAREAQRAWREATRAVEEAEQLAKEATRRAAPVSVLISRKSQRIYVRQALRPVLDAPVTIRNPEAPIGTHLYIASAADADGRTLSWSVISVPSSNSAGSAERAANAKKERGEGVKQEARAEPSNAAEALERVELAPDVSTRISELLWAGGSLIISDQPLSSETSAVGTDIVVTTR
jgi:lipoprotein-anchoring transpeptidase ErfK/SrfK